MPLPVFAALLALGAAPPASNNWPEFRGPRGNGVSDAADVPTSWGESQNIRWKVPVHDKGWSSPVTWGEQVWVTTAKEAGHKFYAVGLNRRTGKVEHDLHLFSEPNPPDIVRFNSFASPTPALEEGRLYAHFGSHGTACVDTATGATLWSRRDLPCDHYRGPASSVALWRDRLFLLFDGYDRQYVACLNKTTGATLWLKDRDLPFPSDGDYKKAFATPTVLEVGGRPQVVCPAAMGTVAHDVETGDEVWRIITDGMNQAPRPFLAHGLIYLTSGHVKKMVAVKAGLTGDLTKSGVAWRMDKDAPSKPSPVVVGDYLFCVNDNGVAHCLDARTGAVKWKESFGDKFSASPVAAGGNVYFAGEGGKTFVVAAEPEYELVAENRLAAGCYGSFAVGENELIVRTKTHLYSIGRK